MVRQGTHLFIGLEDLERVDVTFLISSFLSTENVSAFLGCNRISQMKCATELIKFCGTWMQELRADLAGTVPRAANCFLLASLSFALLEEELAWVTEQEMQIQVLSAALHPVQASLTGRGNSRYFPLLRLNWNQTQGNICLETLVEGP